MNPNLGNGTTRISVTENGEPPFSGFLYLLETQRQNFSNLTKNVSSGVVK